MASSKALAAAAAPRVAMVHVRDPRTRWSVPAIRVIRIVSARDWRAAPPIDLLARLGPLPADTDDDHRVVLVRGANDHETALIAAGSISIVDVDTTDVLPLPELIAPTTPEIAAIIVAHDASLSLLLDPLAIAPPDAAFVRNHA